VLTRTEQTWDPDAGERDPMEDGRRIARRLADDPRARRIFFTILPVATFVGLGAQVIDARDVAALRELAALGDDDLEPQLAGEERFVRGGDRDQRERLLDALGLYGIWLATRLIRGGCTTQEQLTAELLRASGVQQLRELLVSHFGQRAFVIKLDTALRRALTACQQLRPDTHGDDRTVLSAVARQLERMRAEEPVFRRLRVLCDYYDGTLALTDDEVSDLLRVTGEHGASLAQRLGVAVPAGDILDPAVERAEERLRHWRRRATGGGNGTMLAAADEVSLAYLELADRLRSTQELLNGG
jgi:hypothetical protein